MAARRKKPAALEQKLGNKTAETQQPSKGDGKGTRRGGGRQSWDESAGWYCMHCKKLFVGSLPSCFLCFAWPQVEDPGQLMQTQPTLVTERKHKKHLAAASARPVQYRLKFQAAGLVGPAQRAPSVTALLAVLQLYHDEQLKADPAPGEADAAGEPADV
eukprot:2790664-Amphidinium_carterae.1